MIQKQFFNRCLLGLLFVSLTTVSAPLIGDEEAEREFTLKVLPVLKDKCFGCHGNDADDIKGDYSMLTRELLLRGGESEDPTVVPSKPDEGTMMGAITWEDLEMPPKENDRLNEEQIEYVRAWIESGAPWPSEDKQKKFRDEEAMQIATADGLIVKTSGGTSEDWTNRRYQPEDLWAFQPLNRKQLESIAIPDEANPIDFLIQKRMKEASTENAVSFTSAPQADPLTLIRRATFDLTGLPPTPEEVNAFQTAWENDSANAWSELVDRLLESPHYGERWGQHWLDVARYADTAGYSNDYERSNMWRYRDYVIRAFNDDKPYNEFIVEQIAGDELWEQQPEEERDAELLVATSYLRMGAWDPAMTKQPEARQIYVDDVVNSVGQTFLATTLRCVKCHDHKFDPIPTKDYYRIYAAFAATQLAERPAEFLPEENLDGFEESKAIVKTLREYAINKKNELTKKREDAAREWYKENDLEYKSHKDRKDDADEIKPPRHYGLDYVDEGMLKIREQDEWIWNRRLERYEPMVQSVYNGPDPKFLNARKLRMPGKIKADAEYVNFVFTGGALEAHGEKVQPGVMSVLGVPVKENAEDPYVISNDPNGRRLALANWIASPENPLTARSIVNRVWQYHFGKPIAGNPNNFGVKGEKPTHPEMLDWMAIDFVDNDWTLKRLHRQIMLSDTYQMASSHPDQKTLLNNDPNNDLLAYFPTRRLTAEEVRDAMLKVTGELNTTVGGLPVMPEINMEVALQPRMIQFSLAPAYQPSPTPEIRNRRSIYAYRVRGQADPFLEVFNQPNPNDSCEARDVAAVSPQAFTLMNSELMLDRAIAFALRLKGDSESNEDRVQQAFELAFSRRPTDAESKRMVSYLEKMKKYHKGVEPKPTTYPTKITRSVVEEFSGKPFEYEEILPVFENYTSDKKANEVDSQTRALADLCLMLFNSNEFLYIY
jgi:mono/diheme cytochrome c family protein